MEYLTITKSADTTIVKVSNDLAGNNVERMVATSKNHLFRAEAQAGKISFPVDCELNHLHITAENLSTATHTLLGTNSGSTTEDVFDAIVGQNFFVGK